MKRRLKVGVDKKGVGIYVTWDDKFEEEMSKHGIDGKKEMENLVKELSKKHNFN